MKTAKLITAQIKEIQIGHADDFYERMVFRQEMPWPIMGSDECAMTTVPEPMVDQQMFRIKRFCMEKVPSHMAGLFLPPHERDIQEWYVAMDPLIQECFDAEFDTVKAEAARKVNEQRRKVAYLESELNRIRSMTAWQTFKVAVAKAFKRKD